MSDLEADNIERTVSINNQDEFGQAICAFANDMPNHRRPGYLLIGVTDDGTPSGLNVTDEILKNIGGIRADGNVLPQPVMSVAKYSIIGKDIVVVEVVPSDLPPVRYRGRIYIRVGPRKAIANEQEERILTERRVANARSFDARPCVESKLGDLALGLFDAYRREAVAPETISANHRSIELQLASLRLYDPERCTATHAGILLFGKNPRLLSAGSLRPVPQVPRQGPDGSAHRPGGNSGRFALRSA